MMPQVLGLDAGGTKTIAVVVDDQARIRQVTRRKGLDPTRGASARHDLQTFLAPFAGVAAATLGLPYHTEIADITAWQAQVAETVLGGQARVCNDVATAHLGAFEGGDGVLILAGTGSMAWAQGPQGTHRVGGFGDLFGDEGSAYWIGRAALATASRQIDGRLPDTGFATELCACVGVPVGGLINWAYGLTDRRAGIAALARDISGLAQGGNDAARGILVQAAQELALAGQTAAAQAGLGAPCPWAIAGGVFADAVVSTTLTGLMGHAAQPCALPPVGGALLDAARRAGWPVTDTWIATLARHLAAEGVA